MEKRAALGFILATIGCGPGGGSGIGGPPRREIQWTLWTEKRAGAQLFAARCQDPQAGDARRLSFTVSNTNTSASVTTGAVPCPADEMTGSATIDLPDRTAGPFRLTGAVEGRAESSSQVVCGADPMIGINLWIYVLGCDQPECAKTCR